MPVFLRVTLGVTIWVSLCLLPPGDMPGHRAGSPHLFVAAWVTPGVTTGVTMGHRSHQGSPLVTPGVFLVFLSLHEVHELNLNLT